MKSTDPLLNAWRETLRRAKDGPAIVNTPATFAENLPV